ncbi:hypothetical protein AYI68_g6442 [Smittium mucronatum]|uniref:Uncharacterized protein n=1 Tax=Smittium mucronatum TaxID=133383 RepID=A0A1R0GRI2_9FUNG|nr:hypothetical protein AYI68_g6442 [Smittium mucronatum]
MDPKYHHNRSRLDPSDYKSNNPKESSPTIKIAAFDPNQSLYPPNDTFNSLIIHSDYDEFDYKISGNSGQNENHPNLDTATKKISENTKDSHNNKSITNNQLLLGPSFSNKGKFFFPIINNIMINPFLRQKEL